MVIYREGLKYSVRADKLHMAAGGDVVCACSYNPRARVLVGGTKKGRACMWRFVGGAEGADPSEDDWQVRETPYCISYRVFFLKINVTGVGVENHRNFSTLLV